MTAADIRMWTGQDPVLTKVMQSVQYGWPLSDDGEDVTTYFRRRRELSIKPVFAVGLSSNYSPAGLEWSIGRTPRVTSGHCVDEGPGPWLPVVAGGGGRFGETCDGLHVQCARAAKKMLPSAPLHPWEWLGRP